MEQLSIELNVKPESIYRDVCAEIIRDNTSGTYSFQCYHCGQLLDADSSDYCANIFKHLDAHYVFEHYEEEDDVKRNSQTEFLDIEFLNIDSSRHGMGGIEHILDENVIIKEETGYNEETRVTDETEETPKNTENSGSMKKVEENSKEGNLECNVCHQIFVRTHAFVEHCKTHTNKSKEVEQNNLKVDFIRETSKFSCKICSTVYTQKCHLTEHNRKFHKDIYNFENYPEFKCEVCGKTFIHNCKLKNHMAKHFELKDIIPVTCDICGIRYPFKSDIEEHMKIHSNKNDQNIGDQINMESYKLIAEPTAVCALCGKTYKNIKNLKDHHRLKHRGEEFSFRSPDPVTISSDNFPHKLDDSHEEICSICGKIFTNKNYLNDHLRLRHAKQLSRDPELKCTLCNKEFFKKINLIAHLKIHKTTHLNDSSNNLEVFNEDVKSSDGDTIKTEQEKVCTVCGKTFKMKRYLQDHLRLKHPEKYYQSTTLNACNICGKKYFQMRLLIRHMRTHTEKRNRSEKCEECDKMYLTKDGYQAHWQQNHPEQEWPTNFLTCEICKKSFVLQKNLTNHQIQDHHSCESCGNVYRSKKNLIAHYKQSHTGEYPESIMYKCDIFNLFFDQKVALGLHMTAHTNNSIINCETCGKQFPTIGQFRRHNVIHDPNRKKYECKICEKTFTLPGNLKIHTRIHTGEKPYACTFCDRRFVQQQDWNAHIRRAHTGDLPFQCEICGRKFIKSSLLKDHKKRHYEDKQFQCQYCEKKFYTNYLTKVHEQSHIGIKTLSCDICKRAFRTNKTLLQHKILHTGKKPHTCKYCGMKFAQGSGRRSHEKNIHGAI